MDIFGKKKKGVVKRQEGFPGGSASFETGPDLVAFMSRIEQRLTGIEKKLDTLTGRAPARPFESRGHSAPVTQPVQQDRSQEVRQVPGRGPSRGRGRRGKTLHKAVCADCQKDCEIPFQPTGERPVYCKACYAKRKSGRPAEISADPQPEMNLPEEAGDATAPAADGRKVTVTKKGVGKVIVSEIAHRPRKS